MIIFGVIVILIAVAILIIGKFTELKIGNKIVFGIAGLGAFLILLNYLVFFAERGYSYVLVYPNGEMKAVQTTGLTARWFAKIDSWQNYIDVKAVDSTTYRTRFDDNSLVDLEGVMLPVNVRFIDQVTATGYVSCRFELPNDSEKFLALAVKYRTMRNLVDNTIIPTIREQLANTGYMYAAQNYISGESQGFRQSFEEQLKVGTFAVQKIEYKDTVYGDIQDNNSRKIKEIQTRYEVRRVITDGKPKIIPHELSSNGIIVSQVIVDNIDLETAFKKRLESQRDESAKRQLEQQKVETAKAAQSRIIAEGERDKSKERVVQETEQVKALIAIETKLKQESTNKDLAMIALETEKLKAQTVKVTADAESYKNQKLANVGLTPLDKANIDKEKAIGVAEALAKTKYPEIMIIGSDGKGSSALESLISTGMAKQLLGK